MNPVEVFSLEVSAFASNCHIIRPAQSDRVIVVDPGGDAETIAEFIRLHGWTVGLFLLTHGHMDHVGALADVADQFPAPIAMHPLDAEWAFGVKNTMPPYFNEPPRAATISRDLQDGQTWTDFGLTYEVLETPGHSPGSVSFYFREQALLFSGDVLFAGSIGRSDLPGGNPRVLAQSLQRLLTLPNTTRIFPGHGAKTSIGKERAHNPFLRDLSWAD
ncbi:MAG: MBL fold metallo-hydrolase [Kiritimatiellae bacterium]|nr:MBL fold metallo-hydrolase [Kiritimatiellia bacterium]